MHADRVIVDRQSVECERQACSSRTTLAWPCTIHYDQVWAVHCEPKCQAVLISLFIFFGLMCVFWKPRGDQAENHLTKSVTRRQQKHCQNRLQRKISQTWAQTLHAARFGHQMDRDQDLVEVYLRGFELSISNTESETKACSWAETQVAVGLWVNMYGCFSLSTNQKARELC